ncbi:FliH/SctL family protein [Clostridium thermarum]|uniref:FliH/SctL family protein n=1 Tax=Clostridium thermarum TaxID=1716543 RepID=UPI0013D8238B|nr:FliH/SctL family protein [Clostridium thermarum]
MQSSYRVIKDTKVIPQGSREIVTLYSTDRVSGKRDNTNIEIPAVNTQNKEAMRLLEEAKLQSEEILIKAREKAELIQKEAYEQAYNTGYAEGKQKGYSDGYEEAMAKVKLEGDRIIQSSVETLQNAKTEYETYLLEKKEEIIKLSINIARHILKREVSVDTGIEEMVVEALENSRKAESIVIRTNSLYVENIKSKLGLWKERFALKSDIFVLADEQIEQGVAIIEKNNGKIRIDIDEALENIKNSIL